MPRAAALLALAVVLLAPASALAAPPSNDHWSERAPLALGSRATVANLDEATTDPSDPALICRLEGRAPGDHSVWFTYTTGDQIDYVTLFTHGTPVTISVFQGSPGAFTTATGGCGDGRPSGAIAGLRLAPHTSYTIELAAQAGPLVSPDTTVSLVPASFHYVSTTEDDGDGACDISCSLRDALITNDQSPGVVVVPPGTYRLSGGSDDDRHGDLDVHAPAGIYGAGAGATVIDAQGLDRVLEVHPGGQGESPTVALARLTLRNGATADDGGGLAVDGEAFADLDGVSIESSSAGGIGGGIVMHGRGRLVESTLTANRAQAGGGLSLRTAGVPFEVRDSTIAGNTATFAGGGIESVADLAVVNSTLSENAGGALISGGNTTLRSATVAGNPGSFRIDEHAGGIIENQGTLEIRNSVLADSVNGPDCTRFNGSFSAAYTHAEDPGSCDFSGPGDATGTDPGLQPLADNAGPTLTRRALPGSPLIDHGDPAGCTDEDGFALTFDQRGLPRTVNRCDEGAIELPTEAATVTPPVTQHALPTPAPVPTTASPTPKPRRLVVSKLATKRHGRTLTFKLSAPARVTIRLTRGKHRVKTYTVKAKAGTNTVKVAVRRARYTVQVLADSAKVTRKLTLGR
jgi:hypothetical protein